MAAAATLAAFAACSGGTGGGQRITQPSCAQGVPGQPEALCLVSCNLGCSAAGCSINQIAQNQPLVLVFNQDIDPSSVSSASVSLRTASGAEPVGQLLTSGPTIQFLPEIRTVGGQAFFGFRAGETYQLSLPGGPGEINALRSTSGDALVARYSCTLEISRGVIDLDGTPPEGELVSPAAGSTAEASTPIRVEFSEFISTVAFVTSTPQNQPVVVRVSKTSTAGGQQICDPAFPPVQILGTWQIEHQAVRQRSAITFQPLQQMPSGVCVQVEITDRVLDLSGKPAARQLFDYFTRAGVVPEQAIVESFNNSINQDVQFSSGQWGGGTARPGEIGWDGLHGDFDPATGGTEQPGNVFVWNTDDTTIPARRTLSGVDEPITDGVYRFSRFVVPRGVTVRFVGSRPARVYVRGAVRIEGVVDLNGGDLLVHDGNSETGQPGSPGGADGGAAGSGGGGDGADMGSGTGHESRFSGADGEGSWLPAGHAYTAAGPGTRGRGSPQFPLSGLNSAIEMNQIAGFVSAQIAAGGGGGGLAAAGEDGMVTMTHNNDPTEAGPNGAGGSLLGSLQIPPGVAVLDHLLVTGGGGGGAGSHPCLSTQHGVTWRSGGGGAASGGALGLRVGGDFSTALTGEILARGGSTAGSYNNNLAVPGGGGAGGSIIVQVGGSATLEGFVDVSGGSGGTTSGEPGFANLASKGGDGSPGILRLEVPGNPTLSLLGNTAPAAGTAPSVGVAPLSESDQVVGAQSVWFFTRQIFPPDYRYYEVDATVDGVPITYTDAPGGILAANGQAVRFYVQGAEVNALGEVEPLSVRPWRRFVGPFAPPNELSLTNDPAMALRFVLLFDRSVSTNVTIDEVRIVFQPF